MGNYFEGIVTNIDSTVQRNDLQTVTSYGTKISRKTVANNAVHHVSTEENKENVLVIF